MKHLTTSETRHYCTGQSTQKIYLKIEIERDQEALRREAYDNFLKSEKKKDNTKPEENHPYSS